MTGDMSSAIPPTPALLRRIDRSVEKQFPDQVVLLKSLVRARSTNPYTTDTSPKNKSVEGVVATILYSALRSMKLTPRRLGVSSARQNIVCYMGPDRFRKSLILNGHMDTTEPAEDWRTDPFSGETRDGKLFGVGALDMKGTLSAYVFAVKALLAEKIKLDGRLMLTFVVDEESGASSRFGTDFLLKKGIVAKAALIGEPGTTKIAIGHRGGYRFRITTIGEAVHTGRSAWERKEKGRNAILDMARIAVALQAMELPYKPARAFPGRIPVFTFPSKISGGKAINMVPDRCIAEGDVRLMPGNSDKQVRLWMEECIREHCPDVVFEIEDLVYVPSVEIAKNEEIVEILLRNATDVLGTKPKVAGAGPWNDAWMLVTHDIPTIAGFGPDGDNTHAADEYVELESLKKVTKIYARLIMEYLGVAK